MSAESAAVLELLERDYGLLAGEQLELLRRHAGEWQRQGIRVVTELDSGYPENLKKVADHPALIFVAGELLRQDSKSVAVIGSRRATGPGKAWARSVAAQLVDGGYTVNSGLAAGIDTAVHAEVLARGGRTVAVVGTGLRRCYPAQNSKLQTRITRDCAVISQFWPDTPPSPQNFRLRNAVMAGLSLATVIVEASVRSGARVQARQALSQGRPVLLAEPVLAQDWARELAERPGVHVLDTPAGVRSLVDHLSTPDAEGP